MGVGVIDRTRGTGPSRIMSGWNVKLSHDYLNPFDFTDRLHAPFGTRDYSTTMPHEHEGGQDKFVTIREPVCSSENTRLVGVDGRTRVRPVLVRSVTHLHSHPFSV